MSDYLTTEERLLLKLLKKALQKNSIEDAVKIKPDLDWNKLFTIAEKHAVLSLLYNVLQNMEVPDYLMKRLEAVSVQTVQQNYRLTFLTVGLVELLEKNDIFCAALKGSSASADYPVPELRKSGDVDLLIEPNKLRIAGKLLEESGFTECEEQHANHHVAYRSPEYIDVELHTMITEPFDNENINRYLNGLIDECMKHCTIKDVMGVGIKTLDDGYFAYQLLLHMLQHFLRAGFGLKLLCDWVVIWNAPVSESNRSDYLRLVNESGLKGFSDIITAVCVYELGLHEEKVRFMFEENRHGKMPLKKIAQEFMKEILEAEEFGHSSKERMVVLRGTRPVDYIREFHHQMQLNFPKAGRVFICWPFTWFITLVRFLINNKRVRNTSAKKIFVKAHTRSKLMENLQLFKK